MKLYFASGAGAWDTELTLNPDGSFTGEYRDADMGDISESSPKGIASICDFSGQFSGFRKINDSSYSVALSELDVQGTINEKR